MTETVEEFLARGGQATTIPMGKTKATLEEAPPKEKRKTGGQNRRTGYVGEYLKYLEANPDHTGKQIGAALGWPRVRVNNARKNCIRSGWLKNPEIV